MYRTEQPAYGGGWDGPRIFLALFALFVFGPAIALGALWLALWRLIGRIRPLGRGWLLLALLLSRAPAVIAPQPAGPADQTDPAGHQSALRTFLAAHHNLAVAGLRRLMGRSPTFDAGMSAALYALRTMPVWLPLSAAAALVMGWLTRPKRSPLMVREAVGVEVSRKVEKRLAKGLCHPPDGWAIGLTPEGRQTQFSDAESRQHVMISGATGMGKTTVIRHLLDGVAHRAPVVIVDCKASLALRQAVERIPGSVVWTIGGPTTWDALRGDRTCFASKLMAAEDYAPNAGVYRAAAQRYPLWVGHVLELGAAPRDPQLVGELLSPPALTNAIREVAEAHRAATLPVPPELQRYADLVEAMGAVEKDGVAGFASRFGSLVDGVAGASLGTGDDALALEDALELGRTVLFSLNAAVYPVEAAKLGAWVFMDLVRVAGALQERGWGAERQAYFVIDEFSALDREGRHVVPILARAREAGIGCVLATQGLADLARADRALPQQIVQNVAVRVMLRQRSEQDAHAWARHGGSFEREEESRFLDTGLFGGYGATGRATTRWRRDFYVPPDELHALRVGEAVVWVAPVGRKQRRVERVRIAPGSLPPVDGWPPRKASRLARLIDIEDVRRGRVA